MLPIGALIWLAPIWLAWAQIAQPTSNHLKIIRISANTFLWRKWRLFFKECQAVILDKVSSTCSRSVKVLHFLWESFTPTLLYHFASVNLLPNFLVTGFIWKCSFILLCDVNPCGVVVKVQDSQGCGFKSSWNYFLHHLSLFSGRFGTLAFPHTTPSSLDTPDKMKWKTLQWVMVQWELHTPAAESSSWTV